MTKIKKMSWRGQFGLKFNLRNSETQAAFQELSPAHQNILHATLGQDLPIVSTTQSLDGTGTEYKHQRSLFHQARRALKNKINTADD